MNSFSKKQIREKIKSELESIPFFERIQKSNLLQSVFQSQALPKINGQLHNRYALLFNPIANEPKLLLEYEGLKTAYVRITDWQQRKMIPCVASREIPENWEEVEFPSGIKLQQPNASCKVLAAPSIGVIFVPGLAFDRNGNRLGRGAGFYDRFLYDYSHALKVGVCFCEQLLNEIPTDENDQKVDAILTDSEWIQIKS